MEQKLRKLFELVSHPACVVDWTSVQVPVESLVLWLCWLQLSDMESLELDSSDSSDDSDASDSSNLSSGGSWETEDEEETIAPIKTQ